MSSLSSYYSGVSGTATAVRHQSLETLWGLPAGSVQLWQEGNTVTSPKQIRVYADGLAWFAPTATISGPVTQPQDPTTDDLWVIKSANVNVPVLNTFVGNGLTTVYSVLNTAGAYTEVVDVSIDGFAQVPTVDYTFTAEVLTFAEAPPNLSVISVKVLVPNAAGQNYGITPVVQPSVYGDGVQTVFSSPAFELTEAAAFQVYIDGFKQRPAQDYTANISGDIVFSEAPPKLSQIDITLFAPETVITDITNSTALADGSTTPRRLGARFSDVVNVKDFGGDIQAALNALTDGGTLDLAGGTYTVGNLTTSTNNITIKNGSIQSTATPSGALLTITGDNVTLREIKSTVTPNGVSAGHVFFNTVERGLVNNCEFYGGERTTPNDGTANHVAAWNSNNVVISNSTFNDALFQELIYLESSTNCRVHNNYLTSAGNAYSAIATNDSGSVPEGNHTISNNICENFRTSVITINQAVNTITGNIVKTSAEEQGINLGHNGSPASRSIVTGNYIYGCAGEGIALADSSQCVIADNVIEWCEASGIAMTGTTTNSIIRNNVIREIGKTTALAGDGIRYSTTEPLPIVSIMGNQIKSVTGNGIAAYGTVYRMMITDNQFFNLHDGTHSGGRYALRVGDASNVDSIDFSNNTVLQDSDADGAGPTYAVYTDNIPNTSVLSIVENDLRAVTASSIYTGSGENPGNRNIFRNVLGSDPMQSAVNIPGTSGQLVVNNVNQTAYAPPVITYQDRDAYTRGVYVQSFGAGTFTLATDSTGAEAQIRYEVR